MGSSFVHRVGQWFHWDVGDRYVMTINSSNSETPKAIGQLSDFMFMIRGVSFD